MVNYVAWDCDWEGGDNLLTVAGQLKLLQHMVSELDLEDAIEQVRLEVNEDVVLVVQQILIVVKVKDDLGVADNLVFPPLRQLLRKRDGEVSLIKPHCQG